jgi:hypothetical protein
MYVSYASVTLPNAIEHYAKIYRLQSGVKPHLGPQDQIFVTVRHLRFCGCEAPSLTKGRVSHSQRYMTSVFTGLLVCILRANLSRVRFLVDTYYLQSYMYAQYIQGLCQSTLAVTHVAHVTTAA